jgi:hypothetical protein
MDFVSASLASFAQPMAIIEKRGKNTTKWERFIVNLVSFWGRGANGNMKAVSA